MIRDRLLREGEGNVALRVTESDERDSMEVAGRGELQLGILIETMRREGFELSVSRPKVLFRRAPDGTLLEPIEEVVIDLDEEHSGIVVQKLSERKAELVLWQELFDCKAPGPPAFKTIVDRREAK